MASRALRANPHSAPIDMLPVELLSIIFTLATHDAEASTAPASPYDFDRHSTAFPSVLASVSHHWRAVAAATPALWTRVHISATDALEPAHLDARLARTRNAPLDIYIDARDPEWDFEEPDEMDVNSPARNACDLEWEIEDLDEADINSSEYEYDDAYEHPFPASLMTPLFARLLPQARRWRSLVILTDTYAPMHAALALLSTGQPLHAPRLETLALMRCNEYACQGFEFTPASLKGPSFVPFAGARLPNLRHLSLCGVHVDWDTLPGLFPLVTPASSSSTGLETLELAYHALEVSPSVPAFAAVLHAAPALRHLTVKVSGPDFDAPASTATAPPAPAPLPHLTRLELSYTDVPDACALLRMLNAPGVTELVLEDASSPAEPAVQNAAPLLALLAGCASCVRGQNHDSPATLNARFPRLAHATLQRVHSRANAFADLFWSSGALRSVHIDDAPAALPALTSAPATTACAPWAINAGEEVDDAQYTLAYPCPCPALHTLRVRGMPDSALEVLRVAAARSAAGVPLREAHLQPVFRGAEDEAREGRWALDAGVRAATAANTEEGCSPACSSVSASDESEEEVYEEEPSWGSDEAEADGSAARWACAQRDCEVCEDWPGAGMWPPPASDSSSPAPSPCSSPIKGRSPVKSHGRARTHARDDPWAPGGAFNDPVFDALYASGGGVGVGV